MMSIGWMVVVAVAIAAEKIAPHGDRLGTPIALALVGAGTRLTLT
jgi:predicted metal-binding membrane protein